MNITTIIYMKSMFFHIFTYCILFRNTLLTMQNSCIMSRLAGKGTAVYKVQT